MREPKILTEDEVRRVIESKLKKLHECQSTLSVLKSHIQECSKLNAKAQKHLNWLQIFASVDYYRRSKVCLDTYKFKVDEYDSRCGKFHK